MNHQFPYTEKIQRVKEFQTFPVTVEMQNAYDIIAEILFLHYRYSSRLDKYFYNQYNWQNEFDHILDDSNLL